jgi:hypothetical protein
MKRKVAVYNVGDQVLFRFKESHIKHSIPGRYNHTTKPYIFMASWLRRRYKASLYPTQMGYCEIQFRDPDMALLFLLRFP